MISLKELNKHNYETTPEIDTNLLILLERINSVRLAYNIPMTVTSGLRSMALQEQLIKDGKSNSKTSKHLFGQAVDILDSDGKLWKWCMDNLQLLETIGLWLEDKAATPTWVHFQIIPPKSGKRIFRP